MGGALGSSKETKNNLVIYILYYKENSNTYQFLLTFAVQIIFMTCNSLVKIFQKILNFQSSKAANKQQELQGKPTKN
jgi:hypothetical protein